MLGAALCSLLAPEREEATRARLHAQMSGAVDVAAIAAAAWSRRRAVVLARALDLEADDDAAADEEV